MKANPDPGRTLPRLHTFADLRRLFADNASIVVRAHGILIALLFAAALADLGTTIRFMMSDGVDQEVHPVIRLVSTVFGPIIGPSIGKFGQVAGVLVVAILLRRRAAFIIGTVTVLYFWAAWYNLWGVHIYTPRIVSLFE